MANRTIRPSERPIQLRCISRTFSGQRSSRSSARKQVFGIVRDLEEPLRQLALLDDGARAPAAAVDHLLVGEHRVVDRVPVDLRLLARDEAGREEVEEQLLLVAVIARVAGRDLARPVERQAHRLQLRPHRVDVGVGPRRRMGVVLHRGVFRRHAERVPAHRMQHVVARGRAGTARRRRPSHNCERGPYGCGPTDTGTSPARSTSAADRRSAS